MGVAAGAGRERSWAAGGQTRRRRRRSRAGKALRGGSGMERCGAPPYTTPTPPALHDEIPPGVKPVPAPPPHFPHGRTGARSRRFGTGPYGGGGPVEGARGRPPHATPKLAAIPRSPQPGCACAASAPLRDWRPPSPPWVCVERGRYLLPTLPAPRRGFGPLAPTRAGLGAVSPRPSAGFPPHSTPWGREAPRALWRAVRGCVCVIFSVSYST